MGISKKDKLKELIWFVVKNYNHKLFETKLWKLLFFSESDYFEKYGEPISGIPYIKNSHGPTPSYNKAKSVLEDLISNNYIIKNRDDVYMAKNDLILKNLTDKEKDAISVTCNKYYKLSVSDICLLAHKDPVYLGSEKNRVVDFSLVRYRDDDKIYSDNRAEKIDFSDKAKRSLVSLISNI